MLKAKLEIALDDLKVPSIIVDYPTSIVYSQQTNGVNCNYDSLEGFLIPCSIADSGLGNAGFIFDRDFWRNKRKVEKEEIVNTINRLFNIDRSVWVASVRNLRIKDGGIVKEAWVELVVDVWYDGDDYSTYDAVLTWRNSD